MTAEEPTPENPQSAAAAEPLAVHAAPAPRPRQRKWPRGGLPEALLSELAHGPATAFELAEALAATWPEVLDGRRGFVHAGLLELRRRGLVDARAELTPQGARLVHRRTDVPVTTVPGHLPTDEQDADPSGADAALRRAAAEAVSGLAFAPALAEDLRREVLGHLVDAVRAAAPDAAGGRTRRVLRAFGDVGRIRTDLRRVAQGRRTVLVAGTLRSALAGLAIYDAGVLLVVVAAIVFVRLQVLSAYHIPTRSMEPTLHGDRRDGDRILVYRLAGAPERFDIRVFLGWGTERKYYVKRVAGLPGEQVRIREGDLYVDGRLVRKSAARAASLLFPMYAWDDVWARARADHPDDARAQHEAVNDEQHQLWESDTGTWTVESVRGFHCAEPPVVENARLRWRDPLRNDLYDAVTGDLDSGTHDCPDVRVRADLTAESPLSRVTIRLTRGEHVYEARFATDTGARLFADDVEVAAGDGGRLVPGEPLTAAFSQVDLVLRLDAGDAHLEFELPQPEFPKREAPSADLSFAVAGAGAWVLPRGIERDLYYTCEGRTEFALADDEYLMLGDNSENSADSRSERNGPVHAARMVGAPVFVVWPPSRWHRPR